MIAYSHRCNRPLLAEDTFASMELWRSVTLNILASSACKCWPFADIKCYGFIRQHCAFCRPSGVEKFVLSTDSVWYCRLMLLFSPRSRSMASSSLSNFESSAPIMIFLFSTTSSSITPVCFKLPGYVKW